ncbi:hypothetical protein R2F25_30350 [Streptomyces sp. UP1A-1]|nr:hypothetical protein [Streptomyces sp. UP1A-1]
MAKQTNPDHYEDCPVNTGDGPAWAPRGCRCEAITAESEAYDAEPRNMASLEDGSATTPRW